MSNGKNLILLANEFPYGYGEAYLNSEVEYYEPFKNVYICALQLRRRNKGNVRKVPANCKVIPVDFVPIAYMLMAFYTVFCKDFWRELRKLRIEKMLSGKRILQLLVYVSRAHYEAEVIARRLKSINLAGGNTVIYSYRFGYQPYVACLIKKKLHVSGKIISRAHRYDLYEYSKNTNYIPMREYLLENIDMCYPCSKDGVNYLQVKYPRYSDKVKVSYLGTKDFGIANRIESSSFRLVSCSNITPVKRLDLLVRALSVISEHQIEWTHYGKGPLELEVRRLADEILPRNVSVNWQGEKPNHEILNDYKSGKYDLFINVSSSEGLPVSIMEACSFGIPCIATNVGGTSEIIVNHMNGVLLDATASADEVSKAIQEFLTMSKELYSTYSANARNSWENGFDSEKNYSNFVKLLIG